jgi:hypothetical protein
MVYRGSCHCGKIAYEVEGEIGPVIECNCSICGRRGSAINVRCLEGLDLTRLQVKSFDGRSL